MTKYFYDTEFVEDGHTIDLISIALISSDGREYYRHVDGYDIQKAAEHTFVAQYVLPYLAGIERTPRTQVAAEVAHFIRPGASLWGYFPSYDHVALTQLFGTMMDLPAHVPQRTNCVAQLAQMRGISSIPIPNNDAHDALADARWTREAYQWLVGQ